MKKLMTIFGAFFLASLVLTSCGDVNVKDLDKGIDNEEDAVEAMITIMKARIEMYNKAMGPWQELADMEDLRDDISDAQDDVREKIRDEDYDQEDLEDADNWDEYEDIKDEFEDLSEDLMKLRKKAL